LADPGTTASFIAHQTLGKIMKIIFSTFALALALAATPAAARLSQPGNPSSPIVADFALPHSPALDRMAWATRLTQAGNPSSSLIAGAPRSAPSAMMACDCPVVAPSITG